MSNLSKWARIHSEDFNFGPEPGELTGLAFHEAWQRCLKTGGFPQNKKSAEVMRRLRECIIGAHLASGSDDLSGVGFELTPGEEAEVAEYIAERDAPETP